MFRFDIVEAYYIFFTLTHEGQWSKKYKRLCKILTYYQPNIMMRGPNNLSEESRIIFNALCAKEGISPDDL